MEKEEITQKLETVYKQIEAHLQEGVTYYSTPTVTTYGTSGGNLFSIEDDLRVYLDREKNEDLDLFDVTTTFPANSIVRYTIQKGMPITVEACSPEMLLREIHLGMKARRNMIAEMYKNMDIPQDGPADFETHVKFLKKGKLDVAEKQIGADGKVSEDDYSCVEDEIKAMYQALDGNIQKMYIALKGDTFVVQTTPAIPGVTSEVTDEKEEDLTLDESSLEAIYAFMESHHDAKMALALEALKKNPELREKAEKRYLQLVRARLNDAAATLEQFPEAALLKSEVNTLLGKHFAKDFISLSYFDESESKLTVDFIGSMVQNTLDVDAYITQASQAADMKALIPLYNAHAKDVKATILAEAKIHPKGWYAQISSHLIRLRLKKVLFEKTQFSEANRSLGLKAFVFYLNINCPHSVYLDIFQSDAPKLTEMFWLLKAVPASSWGDTDLKMPTSPLKFQRTANYKIGDEGDWEFYKP